ncbi:MAG: DUF2442 domain-containing protein [Phycisphaerales bacterium]|nr:MAG: DUF2442 domain-containing protein [Phycisphaerales bacterium]
MTTPPPKPGERVADVRFDDDTMSVDLADGRTIPVPLAWFPRLLDATPAQRKNWQPCGGGFGIHWPDIDEDLSTRGLLEGGNGAAPAGAGQSISLRFQDMSRPTMPSADPLIDEVRQRRIELFERSAARWTSCTRRFNAFRRNIRKRSSIAR